MKEYALSDLQDLLRELKPEDLEPISDHEFFKYFDGDKVFPGDLTLDGHFYFGDGDLVVLGDLTIAGTLSSDETGFLIVLGDLQARDLYAEGMLLVTGDASIKDVTFGFYEAGITCLEGRTTGQVVMMGYHHFEIADPHFEHFFEFDHYEALNEGESSRFTGIELSTIDTLKDVFTPRAFDTVAHLIGVAEEEDEDLSPWSAAFLEEGALKNPSS